MQIQKIIANVAHVEVSPFGGRRPRGKSKDFSLQQVRNSNLARLLRLEDTSQEAETQTIHLTRKEQ